MSNITIKKNTKVAAGAALVALSGFVPQPAIQSAQAATANITFTGTFIAGITLKSAVGVNFGSIIASGITGTAKVDAAGAAGGNSSTMLGGQTAGKIKAKYLANQKIDLIVSGFTSTQGATIDKLYYAGGFLTAGGVITGAAGGTASATQIGLTAIGTKTINLGTGISWSGAFPTTGAFNKQLTIVVQY